MGLETATYVDDLDSTNPLSTDKKKQGDDHLRLIKSVLETTFPNASKAFRFPTSTAKSANYSVLSSDDNATFVCDTTSAFTLTMPSLVVGDAGWHIYVTKTTTDANPVFIAPPSGTINGYTKVRRSVPYMPTKVLWTGSVFVAERANAAPIGSCLDFFGTTLPPGHLWADGLTFTAADYVELNTALGGNTKPDCQGRVAAGKDNMSGSSANRLTGLSGGVNGDTLGATGGVESHVLVVTEMPSHNHGGTTGNETTNLVFSWDTVDKVDGAGNTCVRAIENGNGLNNDTQLTTHVHTISSQGGGGAHNNIQPTIIANKILVAE